MGRPRGTQIDNRQAQSFVPELAPGKLRYNRASFALGNALQAKVLLDGNLKIKSQPAAFLIYFVFGEP
jgi:hypothetical protein